MANYYIDTMYFNTIILLGGHTMRYYIKGSGLLAKVDTFFSIDYTFLSVPIYERRVLLY